jgi:sporulation protein YlmC with PRC-barrel domain
VSYLDRDTYGIYKSTKSSAGPGPELMGADTLMGEDVRNGAGDNLGDIKEIMLDMRSGRIAYAVLSFGGVFGIGSKLFAVPWNALRLDTEEKCFRLDVDSDTLKNAPGFDKDAWPSMADQSWGRQIHSYYKTTPYWE